MLSCLMDAWMRLGHFPCAREPMLRLALPAHPCPARHHSVVLTADFVCKLLLLVRLPPLHCCYLGPHDFYWRVYCGSSAAVRTVASGAYDRTRAYFSRPPLLHLNSVAGELVGLVPVFRRTHVALAGPQSSVQLVSVVP